MSLKKHWSSFAVLLDGKSKFEKVEIENPELSNQQLGSGIQKDRKAKS